MDILGLHWLWVGFGLFVATMTTTAKTEVYEVYYVAIDGKTENDGSKGKPWPSVEYALSQVGGGHTIMVRPGLYRSPIQVAKQYAGTKEHPTIIKSEVKWGAIIVGAPYHGISNGDGCDWVVVDGFEVMGARFDGIKLNGDHNVARHCWVHNNKAMGIAMHNKKNGSIENNLIEFNGNHIQFDHGVYADGEGLTIFGNIIRHNASYGLHLYPSIKNSVISNNLIYGQVRSRGLIVACPEGGGKNVVSNNTIVEKDAISIWNGDGEVVVNNILVSENQLFSFNNATKNLLIDYNLCLPQSEFQGSHGITNDPRFVEPRRGVFWLRADSPAIGKGWLQYAPTTDFWGRPRPKEKAPDLGAFDFVPFLATEEARANWDYGWAYHRHGHDKGMTDFWSLPE